ncbi:hypothetical protein [Chitinophaga sp. MM2321]|uniref:hypothetical protein n=1 Tax=Chitinophaga sp. MM2321 TaxID=3137178 RepID=UPI0032D56ECE
MKKINIQSIYGTMLLSTMVLAGLLTTGCSRSVTSQQHNPAHTRIKVWKQREFVLSTFHAVGGDTTLYRKILTQTKDAGINLVELSFLSTDNLYAAMRAAEDVGVKVLAEDLSHISGVGDKVPSFTEETVAQNVSQMKKFTMLEGYYAWDEPFEKDFTKLRQLRDLLKKHDAPRLAFSVLFPSYGVYTWAKGDYTWSDNSYPKYVDNYLKTVDPEVLSFDYYPFRDNHDSTGLINNDLWKDFGYIRKKALEYNKPLWFYFQAVNLKAEEKSIMDVNRISAQMYAALAYGVKGLSYFNTAGALLDAAANKTPMYNDLKSLNAEIKRLGNFLLDKKSEQLYQTGVMQENKESYFLDNMESSDLLASVPDDLVIGVFGDTGASKYILIANKRHAAAVEGEIKFRKRVNVSEVGQQRGTAIANNTAAIHIKLAPGMGALYIIKK